MAKLSQTRLYLLIILGMPLALVAFLYLFSNPVYNSVPYVYQHGPSGDSSIRTLPDSFRFADLEGEAWTRQDMEGYMLLINFFSAKDDSGSKRTVLHGNLKRIYENINWEKRPKLRFISLSTGDSLDDLRTYEQQMEVDPEFWPILYGEQEEVYAFAAESLGIPRMLQEGPDFEPYTDFNVVLIDKDGNLRSYFIGTDLQQERKLQETLVALWRLEYPDEIDSSPLQTAEE